MKVLQLCATGSEWSLTASSAGFLPLIKCGQPNLRFSRARRGPKRLKNAATVQPVLASDGHIGRLVQDAFKMLNCVELLGYIVIQSRPGISEHGFGDRVSFQLISTKIDSGTQNGKLSRKGTALPGILPISDEAAPSRETRLQLKFFVPKDFGDPGAVVVRSQLAEPFLLKSLVLKMPDRRSMVFNCNIWLSKQSGKHVFFANKAYLPADTPPGLVSARKRVLANLRGHGIGTRVKGDCIYDYDVYSDLGNPDLRPELTRRVLGGSKTFPYPRRIRTGRPPANSNQLFESLPSASDDVYLPAREVPVFPDGYCGEHDSAAQQLIPGLQAAYASKPGFDSFDEIRNLFVEGINLTPTGPEACYMKFPCPQVIQDSTAWMLDAEFARQTIAGLNPLVIESLEVFPPCSKIDPVQVSSISTDHLKHQLDGLSVQEALERRKLFILDYYDAFMPYLSEINMQESIQAYASRTVLFLSGDGTVKPVAIELSLPGGSPSQAVHRVFTPPGPGQADWLWELAKAHVSANDAAYHQAVSHWLRTHAVLEPFVIATHRQLSDMHPIKAFLLPHCKCTISINSEARRILIGAGGIIERTFFTGRYTTEVTSLFYKHFWRFDSQGLPADLLKRGMAVKDPSSKHGIRLTLEDYPYAVDGLEIWDCIVEWVSDYVDLFYKHDTMVCDDPELQAWWKEIVEVGHADKQEGWPAMDGKSSLKQILETVVWLASAHHAAVNFGQYAYAGFIPNRPTIVHKLVPEAGSKEYQELMDNPQKFYCSMLATKVEAVTLLSALAVLSSHLPGEEYLGERSGAEWTSDEQVLAAFDRFSQRIEATEQEIERKNSDLKLKNRQGAVQIPFTLLQRSSELGITGRGVPNSVSI